MTPYEGLSVVLLGVMVILLGCILWRMDHIDAIRGDTGPEGAPGPQGAMGMPGASAPVMREDDEPKTLRDKDIEDYEGY